jgi:sulfide:quinone oxidoreductase
MRAGRARGIVLKMPGARKIVIAGGGVAALEAALALRELAPELFEIRLIAPDTRFEYRPLSVAAPFGLATMPTFGLAEIAERIGAELVEDAVVGVDAEAHAALTARGWQLEYDSLLLACGAAPVATVPGALTYRGPADTVLLEALIARLDADELRRVVVAVPRGSVWSLPAYELALMVASRAESAGLDVHVALVTPEDEPLLLFGERARDAIRTLLDSHGIALHTGFSPIYFRDRALRMLPSGDLEGDRVIALPLLRGRRIDGVPQTRDRFIAVDDHGRVTGLPDVYAAGDITRFPIKQGGIAAQQADAAASAIAADAGALDAPEPFRPVLRGLLLTGSAPRYLRRDVGASGPGTATVEPLWWPPAKLVGRQLAPFLASLGHAPHAQPEPEGAVRVEVDLRDVEAASPPDDDGEHGQAMLRDVMTPPALVVAPEDTLGEVAERMRALDVGSALVADYGRLIGILTSRDLVRAFAGRIHSSEARVREWMTAEPFTAPPTASLAAALQLMQEHEIHHLPVVDEGRLVGAAGMRAVADELARERAHSHIGLGF